MRTAIARVSGKEIAVSQSIDAGQNRRTRLPRAGVGLGQPGARAGEVQIRARGLRDERIEFGACETVVPVLARPGRVCSGRRIRKCHGNFGGRRFRCLQGTACAGQQRQRAGFGQMVATPKHSALNSAVWTEANKPLPAQVYIFVNSPMAAGRHIRQRPLQTFGRSRRPLCPHTVLAEPSQRA